MNEVKALLLEAIERLNEFNTQEAYKMQHDLRRALALIPDDRLRLVVA